MASKIVPYIEYKKNREKIVKVEVPVKEIEFNPETKVAIIVPFRDLTSTKLRVKQLNTFIEHYREYLPNRPDVRLEILVVEQTKDGKKFNRGKLLNVGFDLATKSNANVFIFHDVDLISPESLKPLYSALTDMPIHIGSLWREKYTFGEFLGGIISFNEKDFKKINGFPNSFWGWGGEDDAMYNRLVVNKIPIINPVSSVNEDKITSLPHPSEADSPKTKNLEKNKNILKDLKGWKKDGLNNLNYKIIKVSQYKYKNVTKILVKI